MTRRRPPQRHRRTLALSAAGYRGLLPRYSSDTHTREPALVHRHVAKRINSRTYVKSVWPQPEDTTARRCSLASAKDARVHDVSCAEEERTANFTRTFNGLGDVGVCKSERALGYTGRRCIVGKTAAPSGNREKSPVYLLREEFGKSR